MDIFATNEIVGFVEHTPQVMALMEKVKEQIRHVYMKYGFQPFETRLVEDADVLNKKGIDSKELFSLNFLSKGQEFTQKEQRRILALRFDLTVPLARYIGKNSSKLTFPFKRYQIQNVYRGEHAKVANGRYNEFYQSDIDVIGDGNIDFTYDSEFPAIICDIFTTIFNLENFVIRISNRKFLEGLFIEYGINDTSKIKQCIKVIDNIEKVPENITLENLEDIGMKLDKANELLQFFMIIFNKSPISAIEYLKEQPFRHKLTLEGIKELDIVVSGIIANGVQEKYYKLDPRIARGLDYYTGTVYETILLDHQELGSVCSGGRYDDLVGILSNKKYPGVGISIGLSRLVPTLIDEKYLDIEQYNVADILVSCQDKKYINKYIEIGNILRKAGYNVEVFSQRSKKLGYQLEYADKKGFKYVLIGNQYEFDENKINIRNMVTKDTDKVLLNELITYFK